MKRIKILLLLALAIAISNCQNKSESPSPTATQIDESKPVEKPPLSEKSEKSDTQISSETKPSKLDAFAVYSQLASKTSSSSFYDRLWSNDKNIIAEPGAKLASLSLTFKEINRDQNAIYFQFNSQCSFVNSSGLAQSNGMGSDENQSYLVLSRSGTISRECGYYGRFEIGKLTDLNLSIRLARCSDLYEQKTLSSTLDLEFKSHDTIKAAVSIRSYFDSSEITQCSGILFTKM